MGRAPLDLGLGIVRRRPRPSTGFSFLRERETGANPSVRPDIMAWIEGNTLRRLDRGQYVPLDRAAPIVRSTISIAFSHDGRYFASTHGDHTVKVFRYPSAEQIATLDGHPRTPWTVRFHPKNSNIVASGCLGHECRVWDVALNKCIRKHDFKSSISCVSFNPAGDLLAITSGKQLLLWQYMEKTRNGARSTSTHVDGVRGPGLPRELLERENPFHMVDFHPSGNMLMTGEKNAPQSTGAVGAAQEDQFTLKLVIYGFDRRMEKDCAEPLFIVPRAVAYNDAGIHFSPCGTMLAACIPDQGESDRFNISVMSLVKTESASMGTVLCDSPLDKAHVMALTNLKFSATSKHLLAGFSFKPENPILRGHAEHYDAAMAERGNYECEIERRPPQVRVVDIYQIGENFERVRGLCADMDTSRGQVEGAEDEINVAVFAPVMGVADAVVYGTQKGRIRMFQQATGPADVILRNCKDDELEWTGSPRGWATRRPPATFTIRARSSAAQEVDESANHIPARHNSV